MPPRVTFSTPNPNASMRTLIGCVALAVIFAPGAAAAQGGRTGRVGGIIVDSAGRPVESVEIRPRVSGYIQEVRFQSGQLVKKGDVLFVIDPRWHQAAFVFGLRFLQVDNHAVQVVVKSGRELFAHPPDFFQKIALHNTDFNISSFGVQITGISNPASRHAAPSWPPMAALAKCRQFQCEEEMRLMHCRHCQMQGIV